MRLGVYGRIQRRHWIWAKGRSVRERTTSLRANGMICPTCNGRKRIQLLISSVDCDECHGTGEVAAGADDPRPTPANTLTFYEAMGAGVEVGATVELIGLSGPAHDTTVVVRYGASELNWLRARIGKQLEVEAKEQRAKWPGRAYTALLCWVGFITAHMTWRLRSAMTPKSRTTFSLYSGGLSTCHMIEAGTN